MAESAARVWGDGGPARLGRLYRAANGIWRYEMLRRGVWRWGSLGTRDEGKARAAYARMKASEEADHG